MRLQRLASVLALVSAATAALSQSHTSTTLAITSAGNPVTTVREETEVTLTASVIAGNTPVTRGQVNFCIVAPTPLKCTDIRLLGTVQLTSSGTAVFKFYPTAGTHTYQAIFLGTNTAAASSASATLIVNPFYPTTTVITYPSALAAGTYTLDISVTGSGGTVPPTGIVSVLDTSNNNYVLGSAPLVPGSSGGSGPTPTGFTAPITAASTQPQNAFIATADFNGDGKADVAVAINPSPPPPPNPPYPPIPPSNLRVLLGNGDGTLSAASSPKVGTVPVAIAVADFNGDGKLDMAVANFGSWSLALPPPTPLCIAEPNNCPPFPIYYPILSNTRYTPGSVMILPGNGDGTFATAITLPASQTPAPTFVATGDFNGDGIPDLAVANSTDATGTAINNVTILLGNGDGTFTQKTTVPTGNRPAYIVVGDFNNDGIQDLAIANADDKTLSIALGNGDGTFHNPATIPSTGFSTDPVALVAADFNEDGNLDLAVINYGSPDLNDFNLPGSVLVLLGNGDGTFAPQLEAIARNHLNSAAVGDFNADGKPDLIVSDIDGLVEVMLGNGDGSLQAPTTVLTVGGPFSVAVADFNGDGIADFTAACNDLMIGNDFINILLAEAGSQTATATAITAVSNFFVVGSTMHYVVASYPGDNNYAPSVSATEGLTAAPEPTTLSVTSNPATTNYQQPVLLTAVVAPITAQNHSATGTVTFTYGTPTTTVIGTSPMVGGVATFTTAMLPSGVDTITATYSGDTNFAVSSNTTTETVNGSQTVTTLAIAPNPALVGQTVTLAATVTGVSFTQTPTGSITFYSGATALAQVPLSSSGVATYSSSAIPFGSYSITAVYSGDPAFYPSTSTPTTLVISGYASATTLTAAPNPAGTGQTVTLTAGVNGIGSSAIATGTVKFFDGATAIGTGTLDATGHAAFTTTTLALGTHSLTAVYSGSSSYSTSTSPAYSEVIQNPAFTISLSSPTITLAEYQHITTSVTLTSAGDFADNITLTCASPPANLTCTFTPNPASLAANSSTAVSFYLDTDSILGGTFTGPLSSVRKHPTSINLALLLLPLTLFAARRRRPRIALLLLLLTALPLALTGCGSSVITPVPGVAPGTYTILITGTGATTSITHTAQLTLTVTP